MPQTGSGRWYWQDVSSLEGAQKAINSGWYTAATVTGLTTVAAALAIFSGSAVGGIDGSALVDACLAGIITWRIWRKSRAWSVVGLVYWILSVALKLASGVSGAVGAVSIIVLLGFINAVRGTFAYAKLRKAALTLTENTTTSTATN